MPEYFRTDAVHVLSGIREGRRDVCPVRRRAAVGTLKGVQMLSSGRTLTTAGAFGGDPPGAGRGPPPPAAFPHAVRSGRLDLPLPGSGRTRERWAVLAVL